ncbi:hypothetical protein KVT40_009207 [Elsinoe batatas]|uniref:Uncharacterized protein n=1 Tax=Elsinoe batatas TaxID=2601811 RepID=A0A8K0KYC2_9PEZI|nr:hypothetical protein KVT40_009207 [Elsinoe batatas]
MAKRKSKSKRMRIRKRYQHETQQEQSAPEASQLEDAAADPAITSSSSKSSDSDTASQEVATRSDIVRMLNELCLWSGEMPGCLSGYHDYLYTVLSASSEGLTIGEIIEQPLCLHHDMMEGVDHAYVGIFDIDVLAQLYPKKEYTGGLPGLPNIPGDGYEHRRMRLTIAAQEHDILLHHEQWIYMAEHMHLYLKSFGLLGTNPDRGRPTSLGSLFMSTPSRFEGAHVEDKIQVASCLSIDDSPPSPPSKTCSWCGQSPGTHWSRSLYLDSNYRRYAQLSVCCDRPGCLGLENRLRVALRYELPDLPLDGMLPLAGQYARRPTAIVLRRRRDVCARFQVMVQNERSTSHSDDMDDMHYTT